jgi:hypothetical protein
MSLSFSTTTASYTIDLVLRQTHDVKLGSSEGHCKPLIRQASQPSRSFYKTPTTDYCTVPVTNWQPAIDINTRGKKEPHVLLTPSSNEIISPVNELRGTSKKPAVVAMRMRMISASPSFFLSFNCPWGFASFFGLATPSQ